MKDKRLNHYSVSEVAERFGVHRNSVINWINSGSIKAVKFGMAPKSPYYIHDSEVERIASVLPEIQT